jgi:hypothetical protein
MQQEFDRGVEQESTFLPPDFFEIPEESEKNEVERLEEWVKVYLVPVLTECERGKPLDPSSKIIRALESHTNSLADTRLLADTKLFLIDSIYTILRNNPNDAWNQSESLTKLIREFKKCTTPEAIRAFIE